MSRSTECPMWALTNGGKLTVRGMAATNYGILDTKIRELVESVKREAKDGR